MPNTSELLTKGKVQSPLHWDLYEYVKSWIINMAWDIWEDNVTAKN